MKHGENRGVIERPWLAWICMIFFYVLPLLFLFYYYRDFMLALSHIPYFVESEEEIGLFL